MNKLGIDLDKYEGLIPVSFLIGQIQQAAERMERNFVDSRQLKVCATCFDLSVSLLRVLEMTVTLAPEIFLDWSRPSSELLLRRLAQVLSSLQEGIKILHARNKYFFDGGAALSFQSECVLSYLKSLVTHKI